MFVFTGKSYKNQNTGDLVEMKQKYERLFKLTVRAF